MTGKEQALQDARWVARSLFSRVKTSGSSANMSFLADGLMYITASGSCFGRLTEDDFAAIDLSTESSVSSRKPSKEYPLHLSYYRTHPGVRAVVHTHGFYAILWSMLPHENPADIIPDHTPYLKMKLGTVGLVPQFAPGTPELFAAFERCAPHSDGFILKNHGAIVGSKSVLDAFYALEELEDAAHIAWTVRQAGLDNG